MRTYDRFAQADRSRSVRAGNGGERTTRVSRDDPRKDSRVCRIGEALRKTFSLLTHGS